MAQGMTRRTMVSLTALGSVQALLGARRASSTETVRPALRLGYDNFAVRAMHWKAPRLIEYGAELKVDSVFISDLDAFESFESGYLQSLRKKADDLGLALHVGTWSICPTSNTFRPKWGTAEEHLALGIRVAKELGSPVIRVILGNGEDRKSDGGIERHIESTVAVCRRLRTQALDAGVKIAVENHAGDMQSHELKSLIEAAGKDYVGACMDMGNAVWALEDPLDNLEVLGPYALTTSMRDSAVWEDADGCKVQWTAMGEGHIDLKRYFARYAELCPNTPVHIETISGFARPIPYLKPEFWKAYPKLPASRFARFLALAKRGNPFTPKVTLKGRNEQETQQLAQRGELERSLAYCKNVLGLGVRTSFNDRRSQERPT